MNDVAIADLSPSMSSNEIPRSAGFGCREPPRLVGDAAHREPRRANASAICRDRGRGRNQRELIGCAVADLKIMRGARLHACGHFDRDDQIAPIKDIVTLGRVAGQAMEIGERNPSFARLSPHDHDARPWLQARPPDRTGWSPRRIQTIRKSRDCD